MKYCTTVIAVRDMEKSLQFYKDLFQQDVLVDFGKNKTLTCGLAVQREASARFSLCLIRIVSSNIYCISRKRCGHRMSCSMITGRMEYTVTNCR